MEGPESFAGGSDISAADNHRLLFDHKPADQYFAIDDLLDFSNSVDEDFPMISSDSFFDSIAGNSSDSSALTVVDSCNSSSAADSCVPVIQYDDLAELEWLSNFVEDSFSTDKDLQSLQYISTAATAKATATQSPKPLTPETSSSSSSCSEPPRNEPFFPHETSLRGKARSKRSRAAPGDWTTRLLHLVHPDSGGDAAKQGRNRSAGVPESGGGRKCLHCAAEKTPQWRTGPAGPKTLCNACGVRYKSGRLVPEYRPASSPTFVSAKHSNSHRKVMELRRQRELHTAAQHRRHFLGQTSIFGVSDGCDDFLIHHHGGSDFGRLI